MTNRVLELLRRTREIYQQKGLYTLFKRIFASVLSMLSYENSVFYIYVKIMQKRNGTDRIPNIQNVVHRIIETVEQLAELSNADYDLSQLDISQARYRLSRGAILYLLFVDRELAYKSWGALTEEAKKTFNRYPYKVDFEKNENCGGDAWTNPKYRRQGLAYYASYIAEQYVISRGATKFRSIVLSSNLAGQNSVAKTGNQLVAKARYIRILGLQFWRERPVKSVDKNKEYTVV